MSTSSAISAKLKPISKPLRDMIAAGALNGAVLDFGCGKGTDMDHMRTVPQITRVDGYDPNFMPHLLNREYDTIFCSYVLNYIQTEHDINEMLSLIDDHLAFNGKFILIARSIGEVKGNVSRNTNWKPLDNGYISKDGMFQRGYDVFDLDNIIKNMGYSNISKRYPIGSVAYNFVIGQKEK